MTHLQRLYETADGLGLQICYFPMENNTAISTPDGFIGMDVDKLEDSARATVCLAHEMVHCLQLVFLQQAGGANLLFHRVYDSHGSNG